MPTCHTWLVAATLEGAENSTGQPWSSLFPLHPVLLSPRVRSLWSRGRENPPPKMLTVRWGNYHTRYSWLKMGPRTRLEVHTSSYLHGRGQPVELETQPGFPESRDFSTRGLSAFVLVLRMSLAHQCP